MDKNKEIELADKLDIITKERDFLYEKVKNLKIICKYYRLKNKILSGKIKELK